MMSTRRTGALLMSAGVAGACLLFLTVADANFDRYQLPKELWLIAVAAALAPGLARIGRFDRLDAMALALVVLTGISAALSPTPAFGARALALTCAGAVLFIRARRLDEEQRSWVWVVAVAAPTLVAAVAVAESLGLVAGLSSTGRAPGSTLGQRNEVAHLALLAAPAAWAQLAAAKGRARWGWGLAAALLVLAMVLSRSRAAWVVGPLALAVWLAAEQRRSRTLVSVVAVLSAIGLAVLASALLPSALDWRSQTPFRDTLSRLVDADHGSGRGRIVQLKASLPLVLEHPLFGAGPGHWMVEYPRLRPAKDPSFDAERMFPTGRLPNSDALAFLVERGMPFCAALLALLFIALRRLWASREQLAPAAMAMVVGALGLSLFDAVVELAAPLAVVAGVLGASIPEGTPERPRSLSRGAGAAAITGLLLFASVQAALRLDALWLRSRPNAGMDGLERALEANPADLDARTRLAEARTLDGDCARAAPHLTWLVHALPHHPAILRMAKACGVGP